MTLEALPRLPPNLSLPHHFPPFFIQPGAWGMKKDAGEEGKEDPQEPVMSPSTADQQYFLTLFGHTLFLLPEIAFLLAHQN